MSELNWTLIEKAPTFHRCISNAFQYKTLDLVLRLQYFQYFFKLNNHLLNHLLILGILFGLIVA